jgi:DNA mismatch repair protein MutL
VTTDGARRVIRRLDPLLVNQIAAGEVIERPASVVKELVENALDAGATRIAVELDAGGIELVRVSDDGGGIPEEELGLALSPHATSKIREAEDLDRIATMGFRGEALASIASVSRLTLRSRTREMAHAAEIVAEGDRVEPVRPAAGGYGTVIEVRNLFFNTPARRKFLRTPATEAGHATEWVRDLAMARPGVGFTLRSSGRTVIDVPPGQGPRERAVALLGAEIGGQLIEVHADAFDDERGVALWGLVGRPEVARPTTRGQHVFLNGRAIRDRTVQHALREAYRGLIEPGRHPTAVVLLEMSPAAVDVNVHPAKLEVRFRDQSLVHSIVLRSVRDALRQADLTPRAEGWSGPGGDASRAMFGAGTIGSVGGDRAGWNGAEGTGEREQRAIEDAIGLATLPAEASALVRALRRPMGDSRAAISYDALRETMERARVELAREIVGDISSGTPMVHDDRAIDAPGLDTDEIDERVRMLAAEALEARLGAPRPMAPILQVHRTFVVTQDEQGLLIVDQHALHERVMFEALLERASRGPLESQRLLTPAVIGVSPAQAELIPTLAPLLERLGIEASALSPTSVGVHAFPTLLIERGVEIESFMSDLFERASDGRLPMGGEEALRDVLDMMACKAAIKAGDQLSEPELRALLDLRERVERSSNCPHGRPTSVRVTIAQLEKLFGRT